MFRRFVAFAFAAAVLATAVSAPASAGPNNKNKDIIQTAQAAGGFETLLKAVRIAELQGTLKTTNPITVFAPTNDAFGKLDPATLTAVLANPALLRDILFYHVTSGRVYEADVVGLSSFDTLLGQPVTVSVMGSDVYLNGTTKVIATNIDAKNGVIHVIDSVLLPPTN